MLLKTSYNNMSTHTCDICRSRLAGRVSYHCNACDFNIHEACANCFKQTIDFFAHPRHALTLSRMPDSCVGLVCSLCQEQCHIGSFMYRCIECEFNAHPLCTLLPHKIHSPLHQDHDLHMGPKSARKYCSACHESLPLWNYCCDFCQFTLHIACVSGTASSDEGQQRQIQGGARDTKGSYSSVQTSAQPNRRSSTCWDAHSPTPTQCSQQLISMSIGRNNAPTPWQRTREEGEENVGGCEKWKGKTKEQEGDGVDEEESLTTCSNLDPDNKDNNNDMANSNRSRGKMVAKFLLKTTVRFAIDAATCGLASPVLDILEAAEEPLQTAFDLCTGTKVNKNCIEKNDNNNQNQGTTVIKLIVKKTARVAINVATGGLAAPVLDILENIVF
ncbi:hypothetical protein PR202_gb21603 [Eleusine coracana subsp. coracana]|uniref:Phorbol-ester/DAG-type domain-containing protein n=1 Tax=Eleusine coracana subsp. coracana TaxID=191504 RepID=A0AAV5FFJ8_ELECO|nr:hypothetical protein QOZ80_7BG0608100 [Eleusine coracana subsp. coracana]GJN33046.1 hypothetical protein PR202_gb21603 [Eleusine coracana subsp. coracana]